MSDEVFVRMNRSERGQHALLAITFVVLALTGLPSLAGESGLIRLVFGRGGADAVRGLLHRGAALAFVAALAWHLLYTLLTERGRRNFRDKLPRRRDAEDARAFLRPGPRPEFDRYSFIQKFEYWSLLAGSTVMTVTGFFMWASGLSLRLFPLWLHQVLVVVHGYEAVLAVVSVTVWHMYTAHLAPGVFPMSRVWLDGRMTESDLRRLHPLEHRRILEERERRARKKSMMEGE